MNKITIFENRIKKNYKHLKKWLDSNNIKAYRIYEKDIPEIPYIIDIYLNNAVVYEKGKKTDQVDTEKVLENQKLIKTTLTKIIDIESIIFKKKEQVDHINKQYEKNEKAKELIVEEGNIKLKVDLIKYLDTGLFIDHRWLRRKVQREANDKHCLNLFCYTGSISINMAKGGARSVTSVDLSNTYLNWAKANFELNKIPFSNDDFIRSDVFDFLKEDHPFYDLIVCDPPSFSNSKKLRSEFDLQRDHEALINLCMKNLKRDGALYFSNNYRKFKLAGNIMQKYHIQDLGEASFDKDIRDKKGHHLFKVLFK